MAGSQGGASPGNRTPNLTQSLVGHIRYALELVSVAKHGEEAQAVVRPHAAAIQG